MLLWVGSGISELLLDDRGGKGGLNEVLESIWWVGGWVVGGWVKTYSAAPRTAVVLKSAASMTKTMPATWEWKVGGWVGGYWCA